MNRLQPEKVIELLQLIKDDSDLSVVIGFDKVNKIKDFVIVSPGLESELQGEFFLHGHCPGKFLTVKPREVKVSQFKEILQLTGLDPNSLLGDDKNLSAKVTDMAIDTGALFSDEKSGKVIRVLGIEDSRTVRDFINGDDENGILVQLSGSKQDSKTAGRIHNLKDLRHLIEHRQLSAIF